MKVLYALGNYPQLSESYIEAEIDFVLKAGVDVQVWSTHHNPSPAVAQVPVHRNLLIDAVSTFKPDILHVHYLIFARRFEWDLGPNLKLPITVRAHSFDFSDLTATATFNIPRVKKVYLFPHLARRVPHEKTVALPVAFNAGLHRPAENKVDDMVLRLAAGKPGKGLEGIFSIARLCPRHEFTVGIAKVTGFEGYFHKLNLLNVGLAKPVKLMVDVPSEKAVALTAQAGIYLDTSDPSAHHFGMPISIAEALATGSTVLIRDSMEAREYAGDAAFYYSTPEEAAAIINSLSAMSDEAKRLQRERAIAQAQLYTTDAVLPRLLHDWEELLAARR